MLVPREKKSHAYLAADKQRNKHLSEINRIDRNRHLPKPIYKASKLRHAVPESERKKEIRNELKMLLEQYHTFLLERNVLSQRLSSIFHMHDFSEWMECSAINSIIEIFVGLLSFRLILCSMVLCTFNPCHSCLGYYYSKELVIILH